jgi:type III secretion system FlhB-like substrate exporter
MAEKILKIATEHNLPLKDSQDTWDEAGHEEFLDHLPEELFGAVEEIIQYIYSMDAENKMEFPNTAE